jgi:hypothetical protein
VSLFFLGGKIKILLIVLILSNEILRGLAPMREDILAHPNSGVNNFTAFVVKNISSVTSVSSV